MFKAFIDDTCNDPGEIAFFFAAWVASVEFWETFSDLWLQALQAHPSIKYFKHNEAKGLTGQFEGWTRREANQKILSMSKVVSQSSPDDLYGAITGIKHDTINSIIRRAVAPPKVVRSVIKASRPYDWCFHSIVSMILQRQLEIKRAGKVDFIFDKGDMAFNDCKAMFEEFAQNPEFPSDRKAIVGTISDADDKLIMPLQAADLLAGQSARKFRGLPLEEPYRAMCKGRRLLFCPVRKGDPVVRGLEFIIQQFNVIWSTKILERCSK